MLERLVLLLVFAVVAGGAVLLVRAVVRRRIAARQGQLLPRELRDRLPRRAPGIIYFSGPHCATCRQQAKILDQMELAVVRVDSAREPDLAEALAVATVPTTVVVDSAHMVREINLGYRSRQALDAQLRELDRIAGA